MILRHPPPPRMKKKKLQSKKPDDEINHKVRVLVFFFSPLVVAYQLVSTNKPFKPKRAELQCLIFVDFLVENTVLLSSVEQLHICPLRVPVETGWSNIKAKLEGDPHRLLLRDKGCS